MEYPFTEEQREFRSHLTRWVDERLRPRADRLDRTGAFAQDLYRELGQLGYYGIMYPEVYGGAGLRDRNVHYTIFCEELARGSMGFAAIATMHAATATHGLFEWGSEEVRRKYLTKAIRGEIVCVFAITEPHAGSDAAAISTRADRVEDGYVLNGRKIFTSNGGIADYVTVVAKTDVKAGLKGMSLFFVDARTPGFSVGKRLEKFTTHCSDTVELFLDNVHVPLDHCLGGEEGGFLNAYRMLTVDRIFTAAIAIGTARAAYDAAFRYAREREQFGRPISKFQAVQFKLVDMLAQLEQITLYTYQTAAMADRGEDITKEAAIAKIVAADGANQICQKAVNIFGGYGLMMEFPVQRYLRDSYFPMIGGGTSDIMRLIVARQLGL